MAIDAHATIRQVLRRTIGAAVPFEAWNESFQIAFWEHTRNCFESSKRQTMLPSCLTVAAHTSQQHFLVLKDGGTRKLNAAALLFEGA